MSMDNFTYARSDAGRKKLIADLKADIEDAKRALKGTDYNTLKDSVNKYWVGTDKNKFVKMLDQSVADITKKFDQFKTQIESAINADAAAFKSMQASNAQSINKIKLG